MALLEEATACIQLAGCRRIVATGDLNAKAREWGSKHPDWREQLVLNWAAANSLVCLNQGTEPTFVSGGGSSHIDLTFASPAALSAPHTWRILSEETLSDHKPILTDTGGTCRKTAPAGCWGGHPGVQSLTCSLRYLAQG